MENADFHATMWCEKSCAEATASGYPKGCGCWVDGNRGTRPTSPQTVPRLAAMTATRPQLVCVWPSLSGVNTPTRSSVTVSPDFAALRHRSPGRTPAKHVKLLYGPGIASPRLARLRVIVHMVSLYNILTDTPPPRARPGPPRPSSASGGPPAAARCGGVTQIRPQSTGTRSGDLRSNSRSN